MFIKLTNRSKALRNIMAKRKKRMIIAITIAVGISLFNSRTKKGQPSHLSLFF